MAIYGERRIQLPTSNDGRVEYLEAVIEADANNALMKERLAEMLAPPAESAPSAEGAVAGAPAEQPAPPSPGICR